MFKTLWRETSCYVWDADGLKVWNGLLQDLKVGEKGTKEDSWMSFRFLSLMVPLGNVGRWTGLGRK